MHRDLSEQHTKGEVLIVEDTPASLKLLSDLLTEAGYYVRQAPNGELALWTAQSRPPELILLDIRMPGIDGFEVCKRLKASPQLCNVPVIFLSAQHDTDDKVRGFALGAVDFIAKPFQAEEILARTDAHVRLSRAQHALTLERSLLEQRVAERTEELAKEVEQRRASEEFLRLASKVFEATQDAIVVTDREARIVATNPAFTQISGYEAQEVIGKNVVMLHAGEQDAAAFEQMLQSVMSTGLWSGEIMARRKNGDVYPGLLSASVVRDDAGQVVNHVAVFMDITERKAEQHLIDFLSNHDALTGLPNRLLARQRFDQTLGTARREGGCVAVMCLDLDRFKSINDSYGHQVGDKALQVISRFLTDCVREGDTVTRQGGDEFQIIVADDAQLSATMPMAQKILAGLRKELVIDGQQLTVTSSIGIAVSLTDGDSFDELVRNADTALFRAKEIGRDNYAFFTERMDAEIRDKLAIQSQLRGAIARNEFEVHYQPQMCLKNGVMAGAEALLRWNNAVLGRVPPNRFIPLAEEYGLVNSIGEWVLESVCAQIKVWQDQGLGDIKVAVNLSAGQFANDATVPYVESTLRKFGIAPACLGLEITE
ncbi:MAG TPA: diguanylate cyclase, partial [Duganella sp.]|uniref:two-component system response regulator n=1 Tax=Duganella sp. TaxID=1904440 RepID=UPI002ED1708C